MEQIHAIMQVANEVKSPVIQRASANPSQYAGEAFLRKLIEVANEQYPHLPILLPTMQN